MKTVNMHEAKTGLSKLVGAIEDGTEDEVILARNGRPVARLVPLADPLGPARRLGLAKDKYPPLDYDAFQALDKVVWGEALRQPWHAADEQIDLVPEPTK